MKKLNAIVIIIILTSIGAYAQQYNLIIKVKDLKNTKGIFETTPTLAVPGF